MAKRRNPVLRFLQHGKSITKQVVQDLMNEAEQIVVEQPAEQPVQEENSAAPVEEVVAPVEPETPVETAPASEVNEDRAAFNCPACGGEGLKDEATLCSVCGGTGKVG